MESEHRPGNEIVSLLTIKILIPKPNYAKKIAILFHENEKIQDQEISFPILLTFCEKKAMRLFFYSAPKNWRSLILTKQPAWEQPHMP
jgi:hypothetical protein